MKRPLTDFFTDSEIINSYMTSRWSDSYCFACEERVGESHYRLTSVTYSTMAIVCCSCAKDLKQGAIQRRNAKGQKPNQRPHMAPLTKAEINQTDRFRRAGLNISDRSDRSARHDHSQPDLTDHYESNFERTQED